MGEIRSEAAGVGMGCRFITRSSAPTRAWLVALALALASCAGGSQSGPMTADRARRVFTEQGYAELHDLRPMDGGFAAAAIHDGKPVTVVIDGYGIIHTQ